MPQVIPSDNSGEIQSGQDSVKNEGTSIIIKFKETIELPYVDSLEDQFVTLGLLGLLEIFDDYPGMTVRRLIVSVSPERLKELEESARSIRRKSTRFNDKKHFDSLLTYFGVMVPSKFNVSEVMRRLRNDEHIEHVDFYHEKVECHLGPMPGFEDPMISDQGYLRGPPEGINAYAAWKVAGGSGANVILIDIEWGAKTDHVDLPKIKSLPNAQNLPHHHGTEVLGVIVGKGHNGEGVIGIAHDAQEVIFCPTLHHDPKKFPEYNALALVLDEISKTGRKGDVLLFEVCSMVEIPNGNAKRSIMMPMEEDYVIRAFIIILTTFGVIVVEPAGNGLYKWGYKKKCGKLVETWIPEGAGYNLDNFKSYKDGAYFLNRDSHDFVESGSIMVAACTSKNPHKEMFFSNFGNRIDCNAWGENVTTTSIDECNNKDTYTKKFNGTSSASAIIAGAAMCLQGISKAINKRSLTPYEMREILSPYKERLKASPMFKIGIMPDLGKIIESTFRHI